STSAQSASTSAQSASTSAQSASTSAGKNSRTALGIKVTIVDYCLLGTRTGNIGVSGIFELSINNHFAIGVELGYKRLSIKSITVTTNALVTAANLVGNGDIHYLPVGLSVIGDVNRFFFGIGAYQNIFISGSICNSTTRIMTLLEGQSGFTSVKLFLGYKAPLSASISVAPSLSLEGSLPNMAGDLYLAANVALYFGL
ncbi:MAG: hypothetical protein AABZ39_15840, partial [Spirochaetota bacterium]